MNLHREEVNHSRDDIPYVTLLVIDNITGQHRRAAVRSNFRDPFQRTSMSPQPQNLSVEP